MAHEIDMSNGRANMAWVGDKPWHGLGSQLTEDAPLSTWLTEAGMEFEILETTVQGQAIGNQMISMPERKMLYRDDTLTPLAVVSSKYKVVQPREILYAQEELIEQLGFKMETAGVLFGGKKFWSMSRTNFSDEVLAGDKVGQYLLLTTACDGSLATTAKFTSVRVVCNNTLTMSLGGESNKTTVKIPHSAQFDMGRVKAELGLAGESWNKFIGDMRTLSDKKMTKSQAINFLIELVGDPTKSLEDQSQGSAKLMTHMFNLWNSDSIGNELVGHTRWGMLNAVTEYYDHHTGHKTVDARMNNAWMGDGEKAKMQAADLLLSM